MDTEMADDVKEAVAADEDQTGAEDSEMTEAGAEGDGEAVHEKTEEELEEELKETKITIPRYAPHSMPDWKLEDMRNRWPWHMRIFPIDQEDCRNCILDTVTKISQETWYYVPKRKNGEGIAELCMNSMPEARSVMARIVRMPFYHNFITLEIKKKKKPSGADDSDNLYTEVEETATIVFDATKCEKMKNTASSKGGVKRRTLWVRYLSDDTTPELLRVVFPFSQTTQVHTHADLRLAEIKTNSKVDVMLFMKGYLTTILNGNHVLALQNKEMEGNEEEIKADLEKTVTPLASLEEAPTSVAERSEQRKEDKNLSARVLKRSLQHQQKMIDAKRKDPMMRNRSGEPPAKRGGRGNWGDRFDGRRQGGGSGGGAGGRFGGYPGGPGPMPYGGPRGPGGYGGGMMNPHDMAAEMMMMQAQLNQTIQNQLMRLNPRGGGGGGGGYRKDGRRGGGGRGGGGRKGGW